MFLAYFNFLTYPRMVYIWYLIINIFINITTKYTFINIEK